MFNVDEAARSFCFETAPMDREFTVTEIEARDFPRWLEAHGLDPAYAADNVNSPLVRTRGIDRFVKEWLAPVEEEINGWDEGHKVGHSFQFLGRVQPRLSKIVLTHRQSGEALEFAHLRCHPVVAPDSHVFDPDTGGDDDDEEPEDREAGC